MSVGVSVRVCDECVSASVYGMSMFDRVGGSRHSVTTRVVMCVCVCVCDVCVCVCVCV